MRIYIHIKTCLLQCLWSVYLHSRLYIDMYDISSFELTVYLHITTKSVGYLSHQQRGTINTKSYARVNLHCWWRKNIWQPEWCKQYTGELFFIVVWILPIFLRISSLALGQLYHCPNASETFRTNLDKYQVNPLCRHDINTVKQSRTNCVHLQGWF